MSGDWSLLEGASVEAAPRLLGSLLIRELGGERLVGKIVEVEAYDQTDAASHSFYGSAGRAAVTFGPAGYLYVHAIRQYFCCDITTGPEGCGSSVLIRAIEPLGGEAIMVLNRHGAGEHNLTNGPGKVCQALAIDRSLNGHDLHESPLTLVFQPPLRSEQTIQTTRIGITKAADMPWRFYIKNSPFVSKIA